jgi:hypothetical protein
VVIGLRRTGKTTLLRKLLTPPPDRLVCVDTVGEFAARGFADRVSLDEYTDILLHSDATGAGFCVAARPEDFDDFAYICDGAAARPDVTLAIDEIDMWLPHNSMMPPRGVLNIATAGAHHGQSLLCVTHRPVSIHKSIKSQAVLWIFPVVDDTDRSTVLRDTRRLNHPQGVDPAQLEILRTNDTGWIEAVQIARVDTSDVQLLDFDLHTGSLTESD